MAGVYGLKDLAAWCDQPKGRGENQWGKLFFFPLYVNSCFNYLPTAECEDDRADLYQSRIIGELLPVAFHVFSLLLFTVIRHRLVI